MAVLFRPMLPVDHLYWMPALRDALQPFDMRFSPDCGDPHEIDYIIAWKLSQGDSSSWPNLKAILALGAGINQFVGHPDFPRRAALIRMIEPGLSQGMIEYAASWVLRFHREQDHMKALSLEPWFRTVPRLSHARTIGIMGLGEMGSACARALVALGFTVRGWTRTPKSMPGIENFSGMEELNGFLAGTDILVCLLPLTPETKDILNRDTLSCLPRGACLINAGRGAHLVEEDLLDLLNSGHIDQAALDVFRQEPLPPDHPFHAHPRVHVTPHLASITIPETGAQALKTSIEQMERGERPAGWVDLKRGY
ncbi:MAG TPA: glyoxylate/hydroxypyruvate reductase A [Micavibrio sp.]|jgi:glyoxylate/hydroxypyruvate reductase A